MGDALPERGGHCLAKKRRGGRGLTLPPKNPNPAMKRIMLNTVSTYHKLVTSLEKPWVPGCENKFSWVPVVG